MAKYKLTLKILQAVNVKIMRYHCLQMSVRGPLKAIHDN